LKKRLFCILFALVLLLTLTLVPAIPAASAQVFLSATGAPPGQEARIVVGVPSGTTLGDIDSISWSEYLVAGYPPHVDIILDMNNDGVADEALVVEYAYNDTHYTESHTLTEAYGALPNAWYSTFSDDGSGPSAVTDTTFAWLNSGNAGPYPPSATFPMNYGAVTPGIFVGGSLTAWKAGSIVYQINIFTSVLRLEIEVDNWIMDTQAYVDNIMVNGALSSSVGLEVVVPDIVAISVTPTSIDFGTLLPGTYSAVYGINVENVGTRKVDVDASATGSAMIMANLWLRQADDTPTWGKATPWNGIITNLAMSASENLQTQLQVPGNYTPAGAETAQLIFTATASP
jgi:hypothetical protein